MRIYLNKTAIFLYCIVAIWLAFVGTLAYVAWHFISKFW